MMRFLLHCIALLVTLSLVKGDSWQPVVYLETSHGADHLPAIEENDRNHFLLDEISSHGVNSQCGIHKVKFTEHNGLQHIEYKANIPKMKEFTLCFWSRFDNHTNDHPIFSYSVHGQPKEIFSWISNSDKSSYFSMAVAGQTLFRLNYPLRMKKWYHTCKSWNGKTGEWQIWVNAERVGRGFHNRLVGHKIPAGGKAVSGQRPLEENPNPGYLEMPIENKEFGTMQGEITMLQLYSVALTAGKAHRDHKHHHAHKYDHNGNQITTPSPTTSSPRPALPTHPLLVGGQINPGVRLNFAAGPQSTPLQQTVPLNLLDISTGIQQSTGIYDSNQNGFLQNSVPNAQRELQSLLSYSDGPGISYTDSLAPRVLRGVVFTNSVSGKQNIDQERRIFKRENNETLLANPSVQSQNDNITIKNGPTGSKHVKREILLGGGTIIEDVLNNPNQQDIYLGLAGIGQNQPILQEQKELNEREPAEAEVKAVMNVCSGCDEEPFGKALVMGWRTVEMKFNYGAIYKPAIPRCYMF